MHVSQLSECSRSQTCPLYTCENSSCVDSFNLCQTDSICELTKCWDGSCNAAEKCPPVPSCPVLTTRLPNGTCTLASSPCPSSPCPSGSTPCYDGTCSLSCPSSYGCPADRPILCPNGNCTCSLSDCMGLCPPGQYACYDASCVSDQTLCSIPPRLVQPLSFKIVVTDATQFLLLDIPAADSFKCIVSLSIPPGTFSGNKHSLRDSDNSDFTITSSPVPDSVLRSVLPSTQWTEPRFEMNVFSPVINLTVPGNQSLAKEVKFYFDNNLPAGVNISSLCLAYISTSNTWVCQSDVAHESEGRLSASADHFSPFAIILGSTDVSSQFWSPLNANFNFGTFIIVAVLLTIYVTALYVGRHWDESDVDLEAKFNEVQLNHLFTASLSMSDFAFDASMINASDRSLQSGKSCRNFFTEMKHSHTWLSIFFARGHRPQKITVLLFTLILHLTLETFAFHFFYPQYLVPLLDQVLLGAVVGVASFSGTVIVTFLFRIWPNSGFVTACVAITCFACGAASVWLGCYLSWTPTEGLLISWAVSAAVDIFVIQPMYVLLGGT